LNIQNHTLDLLMLLIADSAILPLYNFINPLLAYLLHVTGESKRTIPMCLSPFHLSVLLLSREIYQIFFFLSLSHSQPVISFSLTVVNYMTKHQLSMCQPIRMCVLF